MIKTSLKENELEINDQQLQNVLKMLLNRDYSLSNKVSLYRSSEKNKDKEIHFKSVRDTLKDNSFILYHSFITTFVYRILKEGSSSDTDYLLHKILEHWLSEEKRLGIEIDVKLIAFSECFVQNQIPYGIYYPIPLHKQKAYKSDRFLEDDFKNTINLCKSVISLPMHTELNNEQINFICSKIVSFLE